MGFLKRKTQNYEVVSANQGVIIDSISVVDAFQVNLLFESTQLSSSEDIYNPKNFNHDKLAEFIPLNGGGDLIILDATEIE